jgi:DnaK suppressor protein
MEAIKADTLRETLLARRDELQTELDRLAAELESFGIEQEIEHGGVGNHLAEDGSTVQEQEQILAVSADLRDLLTQVEGALQRIEEGTYGTCQRCGQPIQPERLEAFPYVANCIECQTILERQRALLPAGR